MSGLNRHTQTALALGSQTTLTLVTRAASPPGQLFRSLWRTVFEFERQFSRFLPASELSSFNRQAGIRQPVTPSFRALLLAGRRLGRQTGGLYNPFVLPALQSAGYDRSLVDGYQDDAGDDHSHRTLAPVDSLQIGDDWACIPYYTALDLGGIGKGYLADVLARRMRRRQVAGYCFSLGGDIAADGCDQDGQGWSIGIQSAADPSGDIGRVTAPPGVRLAVCTSGTSVKRGIKHGKRWHHIIDPRTAKPARTDIVLATVCGRSAAEADVWASCAVILGRAAAPQSLRRSNLLGAVLQTAQAQPIIVPAAPSGHRTLATTSAQSGQDSSLNILLD